MTFATPGKPAGQIERVEERSASEGRPYKCIGGRAVNGFPRGRILVGGHPSSRNVLHLGFDRVSAAWDNLSFWGYDELSTDYSCSGIDGCRRRGGHGAGASGAT